LITLLSVQVVVALPAVVEVVEFFKELTTASLQERQLLSQLVRVVPEVMVAQLKVEFTVARVEAQHLLQSLHLVEVEVHLAQPTVLQYKMVHQVVDLATTA
jgi:hypothetical protein